MVNLVALYYVKLEGKTVDQPRLIHGEIAWWEND